MPGVPSSSSTRLFGYAPFCLQSLTSFFLSRLHSSKSTSFARFRSFTRCRHRPKSMSASTAEQQGIVVVHIPWWHLICAFLLYCVLTSCKRKLIRQDNLEHLQRWHCHKTWLVEFGRTKALESSSLQSKSVLPHCSNLQAEIKQPGNEGLESHKIYYKLDGILGFAQACSTPT